MSVILILYTKFIFNGFPSIERNNRLKINVVSWFCVRFCCRVCGVVFTQIKNFVINIKSYQEKTVWQLTRSLLVNKVAASLLFINLWNEYKNKWQLRITKQTETHLNWSQHMVRIKISFRLNLSFINSYGFKLIYEWDLHICICIFASCK